MNLLFALVTESDIVDISLRLPQVAPFLRAFVCESGVPNFLVAQHLNNSVLVNQSYTLFVLDPYIKILPALNDGNKIQVLTNYQSSTSHRELCV